MNLQQYQWSGNPRGLHNDGPFKPFFIERYAVPRLGWAKLLAGANEYLDAVAQLAAQGITPIVRIYRESMGGMAPPDSWWAYYREYIEAGCLWFELYNEPNLDGSWGLDGQRKVSWRDNQGMITPLMENWLSWAEQIVELGAYPAFPAMAEIASDEDHATLYWIDACLHYLATHHADRFRAVAARGLWAATHPTLLNHFYQEPPGGPGYMARPYYQQDASEDGWHFEYPTDPLQQHIDPGCGPTGGTQSKPYGAPAGLIATGEIFQDLLYRHFRIGPLPVVGTAGGIVVPRPGDAPIQPDIRYPAYNHENHAQAVLAMWYWIARMAPPWFFGLTLSDEEAYYEMLRGPAPALRAMAVSPVALRSIPDFEPIKREKPVPAPVLPPETAQRVQVDDPLELRFESASPDEDLSSVPVMEGDVVAHPETTGGARLEAIDGDLLLSAPYTGIAYAETDEDVDRLLADTAYLLEPGESTEGLPRLLPGNPNREGHVQLLARVTGAARHAAEAVTPSPLPPIELNPPAPVPAAEEERLHFQAVNPAFDEPEPEPDEVPSPKRTEPASPKRPKDNLDYLFEEMTGTREAVDPWPWRTQGVQAHSIVEESAMSPEPASEAGLIVGLVKPPLSAVTGAQALPHIEPDAPPAAAKISGPVSISGLWVVLGPDGPYGWMLDIGHHFIAQQRPVLLPEPSLLRYGSPAADLDVLILATERHLPSLTARVEGMVTGASISGYAVGSAEELREALEAWQQI